MFVMHLALGGCLAAPPVRYGITADTGGHIAYVLEAAAAQAGLDGVAAVSVVTRLFEDARLGPDHALPRQRLCDGATIDRIGTANRAYLEKEALAGELPGFTAAFCAHLAALPRLPDVIHAHFADAAAVAAAARRRFGIPFVYTPHALGMDKRAAAAGEGLEARIAAERAALAGADAVVVSTLDEAEHQVAAYGVMGLSARLRRIVPGVPRAASGAGPEPAWLSRLAEPERPIVLAIARPVRKKNLAALLRAYAGCDALQRRANLVVLAGQHGEQASGEQRAVVAELRTLAAALPGRVALPPRHDAADVAALYRRAAQGGVFVNPALHEPFGLTLIEAAAVGVPVVATRHGGPAEILGATGHGILVDPRDEAAIAAACLRIVADPALHRRLSAAGRLGAAGYRWPRYAADSVALYAALRDKARAAA